MTRIGVGDYASRPDASLGPLFDHAAEEEAARRDAGIDRATSGQPIGWPEEAYRTLVELARSQPTVHIDDYRAVLVRTGGRPNAMGGIWKRAIKEGVLDGETATLRPSSVPGQRRHKAPVYTSLVYGQRKAAA